MLLHRACSLFVTFLKYLWVICTVCMARNEMMVPGWDCCQAGGCFTYLPCMKSSQFPHWAVLTQVCTFVCVTRVTTHLCWRQSLVGSRVCALPCMKSSQLAQICPHSGSTLRQIQSDKYRSTTQGFDEGRGTVSVLHQNEGGIGKSIPDAQEISRDPRDFPRAKPEGNLEGRGKSQGRRGWISQYLPSFGGVRIFSSSSIHLQGWIRKSIPVGGEGLTVLKSILPCWGWGNPHYI